MIDQLPKTVELLVPLDRARLDAAVAKYNQTITGNIQRRFDQQSPRERKRSAIGYLHQSTLTECKKKVKTYNEDPIGHWWRTAERMAHMFCGGVYKSALLQRILEGKEPLKFPPPCSYSYPCYALVEEVGPHALGDVFLSSGERSMLSLMNGTSGVTIKAPQVFIDRGIKQIVINQTSYVITSANQAGIDLLVAVSKMQETPDGMSEDTSVMNQSGKKYPIITPNHPLVADVIDAYERGPEIFVKHGQWPAWRMFVAAQEARSTDAQWGRKMLNGRMFSKIPRDRGINPLDLISEGLNARVVDAPIPKEYIAPQADPALERINRALNNRDPRVEDPKPKIDVYTSNPGSTLVNDHQPAPRERIIMQWDVWHIEHTKN